MKKNSLMSALPERGQFESLCQQYKIWLISYRSLHWQEPLFLLWYTDNDENNTDRLLVDRSGNILAAESASDLISAVQNQAISVPSEQFTAWLSAIAGVSLSVQDSYDTITLITSIQDKKLDMATLESLTNWRNVFGDFVYQDQQNSYLETYYEDPLLKNVWNYYYEYIFWPRFNDKGQSVKWHRPALLIDTALLSGKVSAMVAAFDARIHRISPTHITI